MVEASGGEGRRVALVTGASRGIGADTARMLAAIGDHVVVNYREKAKRAHAVAEAIVQSGGSASPLGADVSDEASVDRMAEQMADQFGRLDVLVLNASGGLEIDAEPGYAMRINRDAQVRIVERMLPLMGAGSRIVFVTSHQAHFHGRKPVPAEYEPIAASKRAGEDALRAMAPALADRGVTLTVVSGDMIDGTIIVRLLERRDPGSVESRRAAGPLPTVEDFARVIVRAGTEAVADGHTYFVGGDDYLAAGALTR